MPKISVDEQYEIDLAIARCVLQEMYEEDSSAELTVRIDDEGIHVTLVSDTQPIILPEDDLLQVIGRLASTHEHAQTSLIGAVYRYQKKPDGNWGMEASYSYDQEL